MANKRAGSKRAGIAQSKKATRERLKATGVRLSNERGLVTGTITMSNGRWILKSAGGVQVVVINYSSPGRLAGVERQWLVESGGRGRPPIASPPGWSQVDLSGETSGQSVIAKSGGLPTLGKHHT